MTVLNFKIFPSQLLLHECRIAVGFGNLSSLKSILTSLILDGSHASMMRAVGIWLGEVAVFRTVFVDARSDTDAGSGTDTAHDFDFSCGHIGFSLEEVWKDRGGLFY